MNNEMAEIKRDAKRNRILMSKNKLIYNENDVDHQVFRMAPNVEMITKQQQKAQ